MISTIPEGSHCPKNVALRALDIATDIKVGNGGIPPKALISRLGWGTLRVYKSTIGTRKLSLSDNPDIIFSNGVIYRRHSTLGLGDWYILKTWHYLPNGQLRLNTYAIGDCGSIAHFNLNEV